MADSWGPDGTPEEAYSRLTRDLAAVSAGFADYLEELPGRLASAYDCVAREPDRRERSRLRKAGSTGHTLRRRIVRSGVYAAAGGDARCDASAGPGTQDATPRRASGG